MPSDTSMFFAPIDINGRMIKNRLAVAPMTRVNATEDGRATETMTRYYERFARGGFGIVVTEAIYTDQEYAQTYLYQPGISDEAQANAWKPVVRGIHSHGALAVAQLGHAGAIAQGNRFREGSIGPSAVKPKGKQMAFYYGKDTYPVPSEMTDEQIADVIHGFAESAKRAIDIAKFDAIEIHGANGYLLDQFLTDFSNERTDRWGGDTRARVEAILETFKAVRASVGQSVPLGVRISQGKVNDFFHKWAGGEQDAEIIFGALADVGADYIHVTEFEAWKPAFGETGPSLAHLARKYAKNTVVIANGSLHDVDRAKEVLNDGAVIVTLGRGALANPDFPNKLSGKTPLADFDPAILGPIANIKESELLLGADHSTPGNGEE